MAKLMHYQDDATGADFPLSLWLPMEVVADAQAGVIRVAFLGYANPAAAAARKQPIGRREFTASGADFLAVAAGLPSGGSNLDVISNAAYQLAEGDPFFATATDVAVTLTEADTAEADTAKPEIAEPEASHE
jgi:hypothetical protein